MKNQHNIRKLKIWSDSIELAVDLYKVSETLPKEEKFGLVSQMNRSAVSIASNIAEGAGRNSTGEFKQFLGIASGSANELFTQLVIASKLKYITTDTLELFEDRIDKLQRSMFNFSKTLELQKNN